MWDLRRSLLALTVLLPDFSGGVFYPRPFLASPMAEPSANGRAPTLLEVEERVRAFWRDGKVPGRLTAGDPDGPPFYFTEGPPTANGAPHIGHAIGRAVKDVVLRFHRMRGERLVTPMAGWDCHGLPVELEVERAHGFRSKRDIEAYGIERFCEECRRSVFSSIELWLEMSERLGYWLDYEHPYLTMSPTYIESVWWSLRQLYDAELLERGHYCLPYCPRCETPLASHEVAQGYRETTDPAITLRLATRSADDGKARYLLIWTTTPWTLPGNLLVGVAPGLTYAEVEAPDGAHELLAKLAVPHYYPHGARIVAEHPGRSLVGWEYTPPFPYAGSGAGRYRIVAADFVSAEEGTGLVHIAPSFGVEDQKVGEREGVGVFDPLDSHGTFTDRVPSVAGKWFKNADPMLIAELAARHAVVREESVRHVYPFCWRCGTPLIYRGVESWFVRTSRFSADLVRNNATVRWVPPHLREGRFGNFLEEAKDWALSRNRYWGTPLPIWRCSGGHQVCVGSFEELAKRVGSPLPQDFDPHRTTVDRMTFACPECGNTMRREPYTIDAWYDSGCAPFAQYHHPFGSGVADTTKPLDFVAEGLDMTRGWFYVLLVLATALFHRPAYRTCVVNGLALDEAGQKMSKSKGNVLEPISLLRRLGGDAVRWHFLMGDFTEPQRVSEAGIQRVAQRTLGTLLNAFAFYHAYTAADRLPPVREAPESPSLLDRWILSRLEGTRETVERSLTSAEIRGGALALQTFVDDLSTWYLRRSRSRFWAEGLSADRRSAHATLSFSLYSLAHLLAPYAPYTAEWLFQEVAEDRFHDPAQSVHGQRYPATMPLRDTELEEAMADLRAWVEVGRELRQRAGIKSRIPLPEFVLASARPPVFERLGREGTELLTDELNVEKYSRVTPSALERYASDRWVRRELPQDHVALLNREPTDSQKREGLLREALRRLQLARKEAGLAFSDRVRATIWASPEVVAVLRSATRRVTEELLADEVTIGKGEAPLSGVRRYEIDGKPFIVRLERAARA